MRPSVREIAAGKWRGILVALGFDNGMLNGRHQSCPICRDGKDRFRWDDKDGSGSFYCNHCGSGTGVDLVMAVKGLDFKEAAKEIERAAGFIKPEAYKAAKTDADKVDALRRVWKESRPVVEGDEVWCYLTGRGLSIPNTTALRFHPDMYYREGEVTGRYPAMLALVSAPNGSGASIHRTYLKDGRKAPVEKAKKIMPGLPISGAAVRLFPSSPVLGIAEGIETALGAAQRFAIPVWSAVSAQGMESWVCPAGVEEVVIFADHDITYTGQKAAYALAYRLHEKKIRVRVEIPEIAGRDWADV